MKKTFSNLIDIITVKILIAEKNSAYKPNSPGVYILVSNGENKTGII